MSVIIIAELPIKAEHLAYMKSLMKEILPDTRAFEGCREIVVYENIEDTPLIVLFEQWDSRDHYEKYHAWRLETGGLDNIRAFLAGPVKRRFLERVDV